jgi:long-chain acyl-CoA synthetase
VNLAAIIEAHPDDAVALVSRGSPTTYGQLRTQVAELRGGLARLGVEPGDRVALAAANNWFFAVTYLATLGVGAVAVPLNPASPGAELERELAAVQAKVVVVGPSAREAIDDVDRAAAGLEHVVLAGAAEGEGPRVEDLFGGSTAPLVEREADDLAVLVFTAGTSGSPKAAMLTHGNLLSNIDQVQRHPGRRVAADDALLGVLPLFHIFGLNVVLGLGLSAGARVVLVERFDPVASLDTLQRHGITLVAGAPPMYTAWATMPGANPGAFATVRLATSGAAPLPDEIRPLFEQRFGTPIHEGYGLTEAAPVVTSSLVDRPPRPGSIGVPLPGMEVRLVDEEGEDALVGDPGEIWVRGPNVFKGYWENEDATAAALTPDGWLRTGDVAVADDEGWLYIVDRAKDLIIVSGFNVYPAEVEEALLEHPGIAQVAVVGNAHPYSGETVVAFVVPEPGRLLEEDEVIEFCADRLARYKCPTKVNFVPSLPVGVAGKLLRRELRSSA